MDGIKAVVLDVDGVLREGSRLFYECHKSAMKVAGFEKEFCAAFDRKQLWHFKGLGRFNDKRIALDELCILAGAGKLGMVAELLYMPDAEERISKLVGKNSRHTEKELLDAMLEAYVNVASDPSSYRLVSLYPGVERIILRLKKRGKVVAVFTNASLVTLERDLKHLLKHFDYVVTPREVKESKPSGEGLLFIAKKSGADIKEIAYIGDTVVDVRAAKNAGCVSIAVYSGMGLKQHLERENPDYIFRDLGEAAAWILDQAKSL